MGIKKELRRLEDKGLLAKAYRLRELALEMGDLAGDFEKHGFSVEVSQSHVLSIHLQRGGNYDEDKMVQIIGPNNLHETDLPKIGKR